MSHFFRRLPGWIAFVACFAATIEMASRIEQRIVYGAPILGVYSYDAALFTTDEFGIRGKAHGSYEKWRLNAFGFRGPEIQLAKDAGRLRVVCIGASETFGLYESSDKEWPRQLESSLKHSGIEAEVINAAMAGMSLPQRTLHLHKRVLPLHPDAVVFMLEYGSYAGMTKEKRQALRTKPATLPTREGKLEGLKSIRTIGRLKDVILPKLPVLVQEVLGRMEKQFKLEMRRRELGDRFRSYVHLTPLEREMFEEDLQVLYDTAKTANVQLILLSPAMWLTEETFSGMSLNWPYLDETWWRDAKAALPLIAKHFAETHDIDFLDLSQVVKGHEAEWMRDMLHFNDDGARQVAQQVSRILHQPSPMSLAVR